MPRSDVNPLLLKKMTTTLNRLTVAALAASTMVATGVVTSGSAQAFTFTPNSATINASDVGNSFDVVFDGGLVGDDDLNPDPFPTNGLQGIATFLLNSFNGTTANFSITLANNSGNPVTASRISALAFNVDPNVSSASASGFFNIAGSGNIPNVGDREVCFKNGGSVNNCAGGGGTGVLQGTSETFTGVLNFSTAVNQFTLSDFRLRYQSINGTFGGVTVSGASGVSNPGEVPTPALLPGLLGLGVAAFRKFKTEESEQEA